MAGETADDGAQAEGAEGAGELAGSPAPEVSIVALSNDSAEGYVGFDPTQHAVNPDGTPKLTASGEFRRKPGRKKGNHPMGQREPEPAAQATQKSSAQRKAAKVSSDAMAHMVLQNVTGVLINGIGPEWDFTSQDECNNLKSALSAYFEAKGSTELSPELLLAFATGAYAFPRFGVENTRTKFKAILGTAFGWVRGLIKR